MAGRRLRLIAAQAAVGAIAFFAARADAEEPAPTPTQASGTEGAPATSTRPTPHPPSPGPSPEATAPKEVRVQGVRRTEPTAPKDTIGGREIRQVPGAFGDAFRAIESLPGVTPIVSGVPYFFVRGAPPGNTGFFIDGVRVPGLFHLGVGPAVMYPAIIDHVDLYKGAYPASFGRFSGGILSAETVRPGERTRADWTLRLFDAGALVEAPFGGSTEVGSPRGTALVSGRYGYPGLLLSIFAPDAGLAYWDYQARATYALGSRDVISILGFGSYDSVSQRESTNGIPDEELTETLNIQFHRVDLRWDRRISPTGSMRTAITLGYDRTASQGFGASSFILAARMNMQERLSQAAQVRAGTDLYYQNYRFRLGSPGDEEAVPAPDEASGPGVGIQKDVNMAAWLDAPLKLAPNVEITPGIRADVYTSRGVGRARAIPALDPRLTTRIGIGPIYHIGAVGIAHQPAAFPLPIPALTFAQLRRGLQGGYHLSQGLEIPLPLELTGTISGYLHTYTGLVDLAMDCNIDDPKCDPAGARGRSLGLEVMLKRSLGNRISGWLSYTLSRSTRETYDVIARKQTTRLSEFDRTHVWSAVMSFDLGRGWRTGARYTGYSGIPYSTTHSLFVPDARTPPFHRLDFRLEKRWVKQAGRSFAFTVEMFNALLMKEAIGVTCSGIAPPTCKPEEIGPIAIPSLGFEGTL